MENLRTELQTVSAGFRGEIFLPGEAGFNEARAVGTQ